MKGLGSVCCNFTSLNVFKMNCYVLLWKSFVRNNQKTLIHPNPWSRATRKGIWNDKIIHLHLGRKQKQRQKQEWDTIWTLSDNIHLNIISICIHLWQKHILATFWYTQDCYISAIACSIYRNLFFLLQQNSFFVLSPSFVAENPL